MHGGVDVIALYVNDFVIYVKQHPELHFFVTRIGCGIAGFTDEEMAPLFRECLSINNVSLPRSFFKVLTE